MTMMLQTASGQTIAVKKTKKTRLPNEFNVIVRGTPFPQTGLRGAALGASLTWMAVANMAGFFDAAA